MECEISRILLQHVRNHLWLPFLFTGLMLSLFFEKLDFCNYVSLILEYSWSKLWHTMFGSLPICLLTVILWWCYCSVVGGVNNWYRTSEAVTHRCFVKRCFWKFPKIHRKIHVPESLFLTTLQDEAWTLLKKTLTHAFSCEHFFGMPPVVASGTCYQ